jgi:hypothetical protein
MTDLIKQVFHRIPLPITTENVPSGHGICPVCSGTGRMACTDPTIRQCGIKHGWWGYSAEDDKIDCRNCGAQTMGGRARGYVPLRADGTPCEHEYQASTIGRCLTLYKCKHCSDRHEIDSSD